MSEAGYDVWMGNNRGCTYSLAHVSIDPDEDPVAFYDFDWEDMGQYDLPAFIEKILE